MTSWLRVAGLDIASMNSGFVIIEASAQDGPPPLKYNVLHQQAVRNDPGFAGRVKSSKMIVEKILTIGVDMVALEECVPISGVSNTTGLQQSAFLEMVMFQLYEADVPMMLVAPTSMRAFISASTGKQRKKSIMLNASERYDFQAKHPRQGERSNICDAFLHAYIASCVLYGQRGKLSSKLLPAERRILHGNNKKIVGLFDRDVFIRKDNEGDNHG